MPKSGQIVWEGCKIGDLPPQKRPLTLLFQDHNLFPHLSAWNNVALGLKPSLKVNAEEKDKIQDILEKVGIYA
ncbi:putrescine/spermidine ABC transporter ATP-binding protein, partial [Acinetobacter baumannii]